MPGSSPDKDTRMTMKRKAEETIPESVGTTCLEENHVPPKVNPAQDHSESIVTADNVNSTESASHGSAMINVGGAKAVLTKDGPSTPHITGTPESRKAKDDSDLCSSPETPANLVVGAAGPGPSTAITRRKARKARRSSKKHNESKDSSDWGELIKAFTEDEVETDPQETETKESVKEPANAPSLTTLSHAKPISTPTLSKAVDCPKGGIAKKVEKDKFEEIERKVQTPAKQEETKATSSEVGGKPVNDTLVKIHQTIKDLEQKQESNKRKDVSKDKGKATDVSELMGSEKAKKDEETKPSEPCVHMKNGAGYRGKSTRSDGKCEMITFILDHKYTRTQCVHQNFEKLFSTWQKAQRWKLTECYALDLTWWTAPVDKKAKDTSAGDKYDGLWIWNTDAPRSLEIMETPKEVKMKHVCNVFAIPWLELTERFKNAPVLRKKGKDEDPEVVDTKWMTPGKAKKIIEDPTVVYPDYVLGDEIYREEFSSMWEVNIDRMMDADFGATDGLHIFEFMSKMAVGDRGKNVSIRLIQDEESVDDPLKPGEDGRLDILPAGPEYCGRKDGGKAATLKYRANEKREDKGKETKKKSRVHFMASNEVAEKDKGKGSIFEVCSVDSHTPTNRTPVKDSNEQDSSKSSDQPPPKAPWVWTPTKEAMTALHGVGNDKPLKPDMSKTVAATSPVTISEASTNIDVPSKSNSALSVGESSKNEDVSDDSTSSDGILTAGDLAEPGKLLHDILQGKRFSTAEWRRLLTDELHDLHFSLRLATGDLLNVDCADISFLKGKQEAMKCYDSLSRLMGSQMAWPSVTTTALAVLYQQTVNRYTKLEEDLTSVVRLLSDLVKIKRDQNFFPKYVKALEPVVRGAEKLAELLSQWQSDLDKWGAMELAQANAKGKKILLIPKTVEAAETNSKVKQWIRSGQEEGDAKGTVLESQYQAPQVKSCTGDSRRPSLAPSLTSEAMSAETVEPTEPNTPVLGFRSFPGVAEVTSAESTPVQSNTIDRSDEVPSADVRTNEKGTMLPPNLPDKPYASGPIAPISVLVPNLFDASELAKQNTASFSAPRSVSNSTSSTGDVTLETTPHSPPTPPPAIRLIPPSPVVQTITSIFSELSIKEVQDMEVNDPDIFRAFKKTAEHFSEERRRNEGAKHVDKALDEGDQQPQENRSKIKEAVGKAEGEQLSDKGAEEEVESPRPDSQRGTSPEVFGPMGEFKIGTSYPSALKHTRSIRNRNQSGRVVSGKRVSSAKPVSSVGSA